MSKADQKTITRSFSLEGRTNLPNESVQTIINLKNDIVLIDQEVTALKQEVNGLKRGNLEQLGIFVALFTFISISFQIGTKGLSFGEFLLLTVLLGSFLIFFVSILFIVLEKRFPVKAFLLLIFTLFSYFAIMIMITFCHADSICKKIISPSEIIHK